MSPLLNSNSAADIAFGEDASGYGDSVRSGRAEGCLLALEATGHYWRNLFVALLAGATRSRS